MKGYFILIGLFLLFSTCSNSNDSNNDRSFILNINGVDYTYSVIDSASGNTPESDNDYIELYGHTSESEAFAACMIGVSYKIEEHGTYTLRDYSTMSEDILGNTNNKYAYIHVKLGSTNNDVADDGNIVKYGTTNSSGPVEVSVKDGAYQFSLTGDLTLYDTGQDAGTRPTNAPDNIILKLSNIYM